MTEPSTNPPSVLDGIRVLDLSWGVAGPVAGMLLADHGADVIKIEPPGGDPFRGTAGYDTWLRGRRSIELDLRDPDDRAVFADLARGADVVLESYAPGVAAGLGADAETLLGLNPRLVVCSVTGYGSVTSLQARPGIDALVAARLGILHVQRGNLGGAIPFINGDEPFLPELEIPDDMAPGSPREGPILPYTPWLSFGSAFLATTGISAALVARERTGVGQHVETSLLQAALVMTASKWQRAEHHDAAFYRTWIYDERAPKGMFQCGDGRWIQHWVPNPMFVLSSAEGDTLENRRDYDNVRNDPDRIPPDPENLVVLAHFHPEMAAAFAKFPSDDWVRLAAEVGIPLQPVRTPEEALHDEALIAEGAVADVPHPVHGSLRQAGILYGLDRTPGRIQGPVPLPGEHGAAVRAEAAACAAPVAGAAAPAGVRADRRPPLDGVTVLDLGFAVAGPFATQVLADLGANVIKVNARRDPWWHATHIAYGCNRGKRSIGIDLKAPAGLAVLHRLVERADVVHSNMRRDALHRLGVDEASLRAVNPDLIYCHTRGFDRGPRSDLPGNDQTGCSLAGVTYEDGAVAHGGKPFWSLTSLGDTGNGFLSAIGVIQALYHRQRTGEAQSVDTSILNAGMLVASMASLRPDGEPLPRPHLDRMQLGLGPLYRLYRTADGWLCLAVLDEGHWQGLAKALDLTGDERFVDVDARAANGDALAAVLDEALAARTSDEAFAILDRHGVPCEIATEEFPLHMFDDPEMREHGLVVTQHHPKLGRFEHFGSVIDFSATPGHIFGPPPICGEHTRELMLEHGYSEIDVDGLVRSGAIFESIWVD